MTQLELQFIPPTDLVGHAMKSSCCYRDSRTAGDFPVKSFSGRKIGGGVSYIQLRTATTATTYYCLGKVTQRPLEAEIPGLASSHPSQAGRLGTQHD